VQLANALTGIVYQRLLPRQGGGLVAAYEVLVANSAIRNLVKEGKTNQLRNVVSTHQSEGMQTLEKALTELVAEGTISLEQARLVSLYPKEIEAPPPPTPEQPEKKRRRHRRVSERAGVAPASVGLRRFRTRTVWQ
jgi:twitching motility protein PilT